jgi:aspartyl/asparaginyl beta-hydroxylase (cupin superfamily)
MPTTRQAVRKLPKRVLNGLNFALAAAERRGAFPRIDDFCTDYHDDYPGLRELELGFAEVRAECVALLADNLRLPDVESLAGAYTGGGIHAIRWKSFMLKADRFIAENCRWAPRTAELVRGIPSAFTAFFSLLYPGQRITPHWGYYKGFVRYHLGVVIPNDNRDRSSWLRVNSRLPPGQPPSPRDLEQGSTYYWREGRGVVFDDTFLHDAANLSDQVRVVLFVDLVRKLPPALDWLNRAVLAVGRHEPSVAGIRQSSVVTRA